MGRQPRKPHDAHLRKEAARLQIKGEAVGVVFLSKERREQACLAEPRAVRLVSRPTVHIVTTISNVVTPILPFICTVPSHIGMREKI